MNTFSEWDEILENDYDYAEDGVDNDVGLIRKDDSYYKRGDIIHDLIVDSYDECEI